MRIQKTGQFFLILGFLAALISALHPQLRHDVRNYLIRDSRSILSSVHGDLLGNGSDVTVLKVKSPHHLALEIYQDQQDGSSLLLQQIEMSDKQDAYFNFGNETTNLALIDTNMDGGLEIIAPSFDQNLIGRLNVFRFNQNLKLFEQLSR
jgi:hypothetical protein